MLKKIFFIIFLLFLTVYSYKIAIFCPEISSSQYIWNKRVSEKLSEAGHDVTMISMISNSKKIKKPPLNKSIKTYTVNGTIEMDYEELEKKLGYLVFKDLSFFDSATRQLTNFTTKSFIDSCERFITNKDFINFIINEKFDIAFSHMYDYCTIGIIHYTKIPTWIWLSSGALLDHMALDLGVPLPSSYVPPIMSDFSDKMSFYQRIKSFIGHSIFPFIYHNIFFTNKETALFRKHISLDFPDLRDISRRCPLAMVNSHEFYDIPKPTLHKVINIGGLGMTKNDVKPLEGIFKEIVDDEKTKGIVLFTFGSVANSSHMPHSWKVSFMKAFEAFPKYKFFFRYGSDDLNSFLPNNVHLSNWLPQSDLLQNSKTKFIITHCGYNSLQESISAGIPVICIPLFGDQHRNARLAEKHGFGIYLEKCNVNKDNIVKYINSILNDESYHKNAKKIQKMTLKKPISSEILLVKWTEFVAEFKTLDNMFPYGINLNFIQYYQIDVVLFLIMLTFLILLGIIFFVKKIIYKVLQLFYIKSGGKTKKE